MLKCVLVDIEISVLVLSILTETPAKLRMKNISMQLFDVQAK